MRRCDRLPKMYLYKFKSLYRDIQPVRLVMKFRNQRRREPDRHCDVKPQIFSRVLLSWLILQLL